MMMKAHLRNPLVAKNVRLLHSKSVILISFVTVWVISYLSLMKNPIAELQQGWIFILVGFLGAVIGNVTAIGGGLVFIPVMIFAYHIPPVIALKTAIASQAFGMTSGACAWHSEKMVPWHMVPWAIPGLIAGSSITSLVIHPNAMIVKGLFGPVSILLGCLLLVTVYHKKTEPRPWDTRTKAAIVVASFAGGLLTGCVAIGEGEVVAATLMLGFGLAAEQAIALGVVLLSLNSIYLTAVHICVLGGVPWQIAAFTILGCVFGAQMAPLCARAVNQRTLKIVFAIVAILDGMLFLSQFLLYSHH